MLNSLSETALIVLSAGKSSRMGSPKGLLRILDKTLIELHLENFKKAGGRNVFIVLGSHLESYFNTLPFLKLKTDLGGLNIETIINDQVDLGPFYSIQLGIKEVFKKKISSSFIQPVDNPAPSVETLLTLRNELTENISVAIPEYNTKGGHPIILNENFLQIISEVESNDPNFRLDHQIKKLNQNSIKKVKVEDPSILLNLNKPSDLNNYLAQQS